MPRSSKDQEIIDRLDLLHEFKSLGVDVLGASPSDDGWIPARAWGREDKDPSASVNVKSGDYKDHGADGRKCGFFDFAALTGKYADWKAARQHFADRLGISLEGAKRAAKPDDHLEWLDWMPIHVDLWARKKPPVSAESVQLAGGRLARYRKQYHVLALPVYGGAASSADAKPIGYTLFNTTGAELPVFSKGKKDPVWKKVKTAGGSKGGLLGGLEAIRRLSDPNVSRVWLVEGPTDMMALITAMPAEARARDIVLANSQGAGEQLRPGVVELFKGHFVFVVGDADRPGELGATKRAEQIARVAGSAAAVKLPYETAENHGKDLRDWLNEGHTYAELVDLAGQATEAKAADDEGATDDDPHRLARVFLRGSENWRFWREEWWEWNGHAYGRVLQPEFDAKVTACIKQEFDRLYQDDKLRAAPDDDPPTLRHVVRGLVANVIGALKGERLVSSELEMPAWLGGKRPDWPAEEVLSHTGGLLHIPTVLKNETLAAAPPSSQFFSANAVNYAYDQRKDPDAWLRFLEDTWPQENSGAVDALQEWFGYCLLPDTRHHKILFLIGPPRSGKGTITRILEKLVGKRNVVNPTLGSLDSPFGLASLVGKTVAIVGDARLGGRSDEAKIVERLLSISGEDTQTIDRKFLSSVTTKLRTRFMIVSNETPYFRDTSGAFNSRLIFLETTTSHLGHEDKDLENKLTREMPAILNWAIVGYNRLLENGAFTEPVDHQGAIEDFRRFTSPMSAFVDDRCLIGSALRADMDEVWEAYGKWCKNAGEDQVSRSRFGRDLRAVVPGLKKYRNSQGAHRTYYYTGLTLAPE